MGDKDALASAGRPADGEDTTDGMCIHGQPVHLGCQDPPADPAAPVVAPSATDDAPPCPNHKEVQHRDRMPPWCNACGWRWATFGTPSRKVKTISATDDGTE